MGRRRVSLGEQLGATHSSNVIVSMVTGSSQCDPHSWYDQGSEVAESAVKGAARG